MPASKLSDSFYPTRGRPTPIPKRKSRRARIDAARRASPFFGGFGNPHNTVPEDFGNPPNPLEDFGNPPNPVPEGFGSGTSSAFEDFGSHFSPSLEDSDSRPVSAFENNCRRPKPVLEGFASGSNPTPEKIGRRPNPIPEGYRGRQACRAFQTKYRCGCIGSVRYQRLLECRSCRISPYYECCQPPTLTTSVELCAVCEEKRLEKL